ncbi:MAG: hypothetical protein DRP42_05410 [Tenericutes bacterium]|nr:MAG: hypothetical protein DRP42_05410 [Mycoplasmatota bacterium]
MIKELKVEDRLPKYLLLENVTALFSPANEKGLNQ